MKQTSRTAALTAILMQICLLAMSAHAQQHAGQYDLADIEYGAQLFAERCVICHGERGDLLPQANLRTGTYRNASTDRDLARVLRDGVENTAMVATGHANAEITALVAYLRNITSFDPSASGISLGDPRRGRSLFEGRGECLDCHRVSPAGPRYAPALTSIGAIRTAATLRRTLLDPDAGMLPINRSVRAVTASGRVIEGRRLNEDTFTVQLISADEQLLSLDKAALREYTINTASAMPAYSEIFSEAEIADLLAYLLSLKGSAQ